MRCSQNCAVYVPQFGTLWRDADWCKEQYSVSGSNGESIIKTKKWFGFRLHLIEDATYEIPVAFSVTKASVGEQTETKELLEGWGENPPIPGYESGI